MLSTLYLLDEQTVPSKTVPSRSGTDGPSVQRSSLCPVPSTFIACVSVLVNIDRLCPVPVNRLCQCARHLSSQHFFYKSMTKKGDGEKSRAAKGEKKERKSTAVEKKKSRKKSKRATSKKPTTKKPKTVPPVTTDATTAKRVPRKGTEEKYGLKKRK
uniref:Uncharacterized protein n=1 Tax=Globodera pallida TaxID=36090 RepID=A0A183C5Z1_GLOPA